MKPFEIRDIGMNQIFTAFKRCFLYFLSNITINHKFQEMLFQKRPQRLSDSTHLFLKNKKSYHYI